MVESRRQRQSDGRVRRTPAERKWHWLAILLTCALHGVFVLVVWLQMRPPVITAPAQAVGNEALQIRFVRVSTGAATSPPQPPATPTPPPRPPVRRQVPPTPGAISLQVPTRAPPDLYDEHGQPLLPVAASSAPAAPRPDYVQHALKGDSQIMQHRSPIEYQGTRFDEDWGKSNAVDDALQKLVDKTTVKKTIRLPAGIRIHCGISLAMLAGGCGGDPPSPPSAKIGDERLSMAPARSLDGHAHAPEPPSEEACVAMYRAGKPLEWGCPVDTPNRAVDQEMRERAEQAAQGN